MMKLISIFILACLCHSIFAQSFATVNQNEYIGQVYKYSFALGNVELFLRENNTYMASYSSEGMYWYNEGTYEFRKDIIQLKAEVCKSSSESDDQINCKETLGNAKVELLATSTSLYYSEYLVVTSDDNHNLLTTGEDNNSFSIGVPGKELPEGTVRMVNGVKVITMGLQTGKTTSEVKIRNSPSTKGEVLKYWPGIYEEDMKAVPIDTYVTVIARTENKEQVQKWNNYWYLINVGGNTEVWMFGEFVKF